MKDNSMTILFVDDDEEILRSLGTGLERLGFVVECEKTPDDALRAIEEDPAKFDVVIMDQVFGLNASMDGIEATRRIKEVYPDLDVIVLTGYAETEKGIDALRAGAYDYIPKPPDSIVLETHIKYATERKKLRMTAKEKDRLSKAIEEMGDEVIILDKEYNILMASRAKKLSFGEDIEGEKCHKVFEGKEQPCVGCPTLRSIREEQIVRVSEWHHHHPLDDKDYVVDITAAPLRNEYGITYGAIEVCRDVTNRTIINNIAEKIQGTSNLEQIYTIMRQNMPHLRYDRARLYLKEGNEFKGVASVVVPWNPDFGAFVFNIQEDPPSLMLIKHQCPLIFRVLSEGDKRIKDITGGKIVYTDEDPCKGKLNRDVDEWLEIPLITAGEIIGKISIDNNESKRPIDEYDLPLMGLFGRYTANAIWNSRTHTELQNRAKQRQKEQETLRRADAEILKSLRLQEMLNAILREAKKLVPFDCAVIRQWDEYAGKFILRARKGKYRGRIPIYVEEDIGISGECAKKKKTVVANDLRERPAYQELLKCVTDPEEKKFLNWINSGVSIPLRIGGRLIGILTVMKQLKNGFQNQERITLLEDFANRAVIALRYTELLEANAKFIDFEAHALKNRIQPIKTCVGLLLDSNINSDYKEVCEILDNELVRLSNTVNNILYTAQNRENGLSIKKELVDVKKFIEEIVRAFKLVAEDWGYQIRTEIEDNIGSLSFDKNKVFDAIVNLVDNAIKYSEGTEIIVSASLDRNFLTFSVSDNGRGIETKEQEKVFDKFYRTEAVKNKADGSGIGLAVVKAVAEVHGGRVRLESILIRQGTKVYMTLPVE